MKRYILFLLGFLPLATLAQRVELSVAGNMVEIPYEQTQTELKKGWKIVDIQLNDRKVRYLWGKQAKQLTDDQRPVFQITPGKNETLADYAIIRLKRMRQYRQLPKANPVNNDYIRIDLNAFSIQPVGELAFTIQPKEPLPQGEYILLNLLQQTQGELGDYIVFPFQIP